jgi:hypothetical protein
VVTLPVAFSGILFSVALRRTKSIASAMSMNIVGALFGGALEYLAMWLGYEALYVIAIGLYAVAILLLLKPAADEIAEPGL